MFFGYWLIDIDIALFVSVAKPWLGRVAHWPWPRCRLSWNLQRYREFFLDGIGWAMFYTAWKIHSSTAVCAVCRLSGFSGFAPGLPMGGGGSAPGPCWGLTTPMQTPCAVPTGLPNPAWLRHWRWDIFYDRFLRISFHMCVLYRDIHL